MLVVTFASQLFRSLDELIYLNFNFWPQKLIPLGNENQFVL